MTLRDWICRKTCRKHKSPHKQEMVEAAKRLHQEAVALREGVVDAAGGYRPYLQRYSEAREPIARMLEKMQEGRDAD